MTKKNNIKMKKEKKILLILVILFIPFLIVGLNVNFINSAVREYNRDINTFTFIREEGTAYDKHTENMIQEIKEELEENATTKVLFKSQIIQNKVLFDFDFLDFLKKDVKEEAELKRKTITINKKTTEDDITDYLEYIKKQNKALDDLFIDMNSNNTVYFTSSITLSLIVLLYVVFKK